MNPTSIRINEEIMEKVRAEAKKEKRSVSGQIEYIIQQYYELKQLLNK